MKHMACGKVALLAVFALAGCYSYPSEAINNSSYNTVQATPVFATIGVGDSDQVLVRLVNAANNGAITSYTVAAVGAGIAVHYVATYRPIQNTGKDSLVNTVDKSMQEYYVVGVTPGQYTFTFTPTSVNTGVSTKVTVVVVPSSLGPALSKTTAFAGDTIVLTAPFNTAFSQKSAVTFPTGVATIVGRAADSSSITFIASSGMTGPATVTLVGTPFNPVVQTATLTTSDSLTTPPFTLAMSLSGNQAAGDTVTLTAPSHGVFSQTSAVSFLVGAAPVIVLRSPDSTEIKFQLAPGDTGSATVTEVGAATASVVPRISVTTTNRVSVPAIPFAPTTLSATTPAFGAPVTVTLGGGLRFLSSSTISFGPNNAAFILSMSPDSTSAVVVPNAIPGGGSSGGVVSYTNIALSALTASPLSVTGDKSLTIGSLTSDPNATALATASIFALPASGQNTVLSDSGPFINNASQCGGESGDGCRLYKVVITASTTFDVTLVWQGGADMGLYLLDSGGHGLNAIADNNGQGASGQPEVGTQTLAPGTYYLGVMFFGTGSGYPPSANTVPPTFFQMLVSTH